MSDLSGFCIDDLLSEINKRAKQKVNTITTKTPQNTVCWLKRIKTMIIKL